jgi:hypothetical protein
MLSRPLRVATVVSVAVTDPSNMATRSSLMMHNSIRVENDVVQPARDWNI